MNLQQRHPLPPLLSAARFISQFSAHLSAHDLWAGHDGDEDDNDDNDGEGDDNEYDDGDNGDDNGDGDGCDDDGDANFVFISQVGIQYYNGHFYV